MVRLVKRFKETKGQLKFSGLQPKTLNLFESLRLDKIFLIYETKEEALNDFK
jgi:anti-anti-sigma regulatory factor